MTTFPKTTNKQQEIIKLLYRYRFLNRIQIQQFLHHKDKVRTSTWLKDLKEKRYVGWIYDASDFAAKTKPAINYICLNGIRLLRVLGDFPPEEIRKRYTEAKRKPSFVDRCLLLADCCIDALSSSDENVQFMCILQADYLIADNDYHFLEELMPHACFVKNKGGEVTNFLFEIFGSGLPRYKLRKRIKDYVEFLDGEHWQDETSNDESPIVQMAFDAKADLIYAKRRAKLELAKIYDDDVPEVIKLRFTTSDQIRRQGFTSKIWEKL